MSLPPLSALYSWACIGTIACCIVAGLSLLGLLLVAIWKGMR